MVGDRLDEEIVEPPAVLAIVAGLVNLEQDFGLGAGDRTTGLAARRDQDAGAQGGVLGITADNITCEVLRVITPCRTSLSASTASAGAMFGAMAMAATISWNSADAPIRMSLSTGLFMFVLPVPQGFYGWRRSVTGALTEALVGNTDIGGIVWLRKLGRTRARIGSTAPVAVRNRWQVKGIRCAFRAVVTAKICEQSLTSGRFWAVGQMLRRI